MYSFHVHRNILYWSLNEYPNLARNGTSYIFVNSNSYFLYKYCLFWWVLLHLYLSKIFTNTMHKYILSKWINNTETYYRSSYIIKLKNVNKNFICEFIEIQLSAFQSHVICFKRISVLAYVQNFLFTILFLMQFIKENDWLLWSWKKQLSVVTKVNIIKYIFSKNLLKILDISKKTVELTVTIFLWNLMIYVISKILLLKSRTSLILSLKNILANIDDVWKNYFYKICKAF